MEVIRFGTHEEMLQHLRQASTEAFESMHPAQAAITFGDCWVQFHDIANRHLIFGRVMPLADVLAGEIEAGATKHEAQGTVRQTVRDLAAGYMYGRAHDRYNVEGELGQTHKASVWPIEEALFNSCAEVNWQMDLLPLSQKLNLQIAFSSLRGHLRAGA